MVRYEYKDVDEFIADRSFPTHQALRARRLDELKFGQILRNVMKHAFECGVVHQGGDRPEEDYE